MMLNFVRPLWKPPDKSGKFYVVSLVVGTISVYLLVFWCINGFQVVKVKIAHYVFAGMPTKMGYLEK